MLFATVPLTLPTLSPPHTVQFVTQTFLKLSRYRAKNHAGSRSILFDHSWLYVSTNRTKFSSSTREICTNDPFIFHVCCSTADTGINSKKKKKQKGENSPRARAVTLDSFETIGEEAQLLALNEPINGRGRVIEAQCLDSAKWTGGHTQRTRLHQRFA